MKRIVIALALLSTACNGRLDVTPELLDACSGVPAENIETIISLVESDRLAGWSYSEEINTLLRSCGSDVVCGNCGVRIIEQVYSGGW